MSAFTDALKRQIEMAVQNSLNKEVKQVMRDVVSKHVDSDVYDAYTPTHYKRRGDSMGSGGLGDLDNIIGSVQGTTLIVEDVAKANDRYKTSMSGQKIAGVIEYGSNKGFGQYDFKEIEPRPFLRNSVEELNSTKEHILALKNGLTRNGLNVR
jgi:hypothetical protein